MREIWKAVPGWDMYEVSNQGRVRNRTTGKLRKIGLSGRLNLGNTHKKGENWSQVAVAKLMLMAFVGPKPFAGAVARHLDDDTANNVLVNIAWGSKSENMEDAIRNGGYKLGEQHPCSIVIPNEAALEIPRLYKPRTPGRTQQDLAKRFGISRRMVRTILSGTNWRVRS